MNEQKHTQGPWATNTYGGSDFGIYSEVEPNKPDFVLVRGEHDDPTAVATLNLLVAAPDMYEALTLLMESVVSLDEYIETTEAGHLAWGHTLDHYRIALEALAKAEGR